MGYNLHIGWIDPRSQSGVRSLVVALLSRVVSASHQAIASPPRRWPEAPLSVVKSASLEYNVELDRYAKTSACVRAPMRQLLPTRPGLSPVHATMSLAPIQPLWRPQCPTAVLRSIVSSSAHMSSSTHSDGPAHGRDSHASRPTTNPGTDVTSAGTSTSPSFPDAMPGSPPDGHPQPAATSASQPPAATGPPPAIAPASPSSGAAAGAVLVLRARAISARDAIGRASSALMGAASDLGVKLNQVTGYDAIEELKRRVDEAAHRLADAREELRDSKASYEEVVAEQG
ncbi:hypothetical protein Vretimale_16416 [Volvox reticuliferus]|nr:hypothetical protein Vretifemale_8608 [Volvox reticuliferus]GIM13274.1 hypothetical protein Vretimale_16416 [Volvox reticuliferus]